MSFSVSFFRSLLFYFGYILSGLFASVLACLVGPFIKLEQRLVLFSLWPRFANYFLYITCNINVVVDGLENIPKKPCVIVSNHQGQWETFYFQYFFYPMVTVLKKELLFIPIWGWAMKLLWPVAINRGRPLESFKKVLNEGLKRLSAGYSVLFFPEGTRKKPNEIGKYASSAFNLAVEAGVQVLPLAHNSGDCWPAHLFFKNPGTIHLKIGKPYKIRDKPSVEARKAAIWAEKCTLSFQKKVKS